MALKLSVGVDYLNSNQNNVNDQGCSVVLVDEDCKILESQPSSHERRVVVEELQLQDPAQTTANAKKKSIFINQINGTTLEPSPIMSMTKNAEPFIIRKILSGSHSPAIDITPELRNPSVSSPHVVSTTHIQRVRLQRSYSSDYRGELRKKIFERRKAEGKNMINLEEEEEKRKRELQNLNKLTQRDIEKRLRQRKSNRMAAKRCREKKRLKGLKIEMDISIHQQRNEELKRTLKLLEAEKEVLQKIWREANNQPGCVVSQETIAILKNKNYEEFIPKPLSDFNNHNKHDSSAASSSDEKVNIPMDKRQDHSSAACTKSVQQGVEECVKYCQDVMRNGITKQVELSSDLSKKSFKSCAINSEFNSHVRDQSKTDFHKRKEFRIPVIDLTDNDSASSDVKLQKDTETVIDLTDKSSISDRGIRKDSLQRIDSNKVQARSLLLEAAEAAYCEINYLGETSLRSTESSSQESNVSECTIDNGVKEEDDAIDDYDEINYLEETSLRSTESSSQEYNVSECTIDNGVKGKVKEEDDANDYDDDDILPLVIDFGIDEKETI